MLGIIDYGMGNLLSVFHAVRAVGYNAEICQHPEELFQMDKIIFPGVGAFQHCMQALKAKGLVDALNEVVLKKGVPILGICLGMQAMTKKSDEGNEQEGLGWFDGEVVRLGSSDPTLRVPHVGWNKVLFDPGCKLFTGIPTDLADFYFTHSFCVTKVHANEVKGICHYGEDFTAVICKDNMFAVQFHPEKSQDVGLKLIENFVNLDI